MDGLDKIKNEFENFGKGFADGLLKMSCSPGMMLKYFGLSDLSVGELIDTGIMAYGDEQIRKTKSYQIGSGIGDSIVIVSLVFPVITVGIFLSGAGLDYQARIWTSEEKLMEHNQKLNEYYK